MTSYTSKPMSFLILICITAALQAQDVFQMPDGLTNLEFVDVGDPGNPPDTNGLGAVSYRYRISKYEITTAQWVAFLNAKAKADADGGLWNNDMDKIRSGEGVRCEIKRSGEMGSYVPYGCGGLCKSSGDTRQLSGRLPVL